MDLMRRLNQRGDEGEMTAGDEKKGSVFLSFSRKSLSFSFCVHLIDFFARRWILLSFSHDEPGRLSLFLSSLRDYPSPQTPPPLRWCFLTLPIPASWSVGTAACPELWALRRWVIMSRRTM
jgi:hypothetical protein